MHCSNHDDCSLALRTMIAFAVSSKRQSSSQHGGQLQSSSQGTGHGEDFSAPPRSMTPYTVYWIQPPMLQRPLTSSAAIALYDENDLAKQSGQESKETPFSSWIHEAVSETEGNELATRSASGVATHNSVTRLVRYSS
jgi:hypothetical protein